jgi:chaperonin cofactor prefoldin
MEQADEEISSISNSRTKIARKIFEATITKHELSRHHEPTNSNKMVGFVKLSLTLGSAKV